MTRGQAVVASIDALDRLSVQFKAVAADCFHRDYTFGQCMIAFRGAAVERQETTQTMMREHAVDEAKRDERSLQRQGLVLPPGLKRKGASRR